jgi:hypothetical protein
MNREGIDWLDARLCRSRGRALALLYVIGPWIPEDSNAGWVYRDTLLWRGQMGLNTYRRAVKEAVSARELEVVVNGGPVRSSGKRSNLYRLPFLTAEGKLDKSKLDSEGRMDLSLGMVAAEAMVEELTGRLRAESDQVSVADQKQIDAQGYAEARRRLEAQISSSKDDGVPF